MNGADVSRRRLFAQGGVGALALAGLATAAEGATPQTAAETANIKVVQDFCATWGAPDFAPDKVMPAYLASDASVRPIDSQPAVTGPAAAAAAFKPFVQNGERFKVKYLSVFARGPVVITHRIDTQVAPPDKPHPQFEVVGVFVVRDGKIKEWTDYAVA